MIFRKGQLVEYRRDQYFCWNRETHSLGFTFQGKRPQGRVAHEVKKANSETLIWVYWPTSLYGPFKKPGKVKYICRAGDLKIKRGVKNAKAN